MTRSILMTCKAEFRIEKADLPRLAEALQLPPTFHCKQRTSFDGMEGLCMLLKRVSYPCRYSDLIPRFGVWETGICFKPYNKSLFAFAAMPQIKTNI